MKRPLLLAFAGLLVGVVLAPFASSAFSFRGDPIVLTGTKQSLRVVYFGGDGVSSEYALEFGQPAWKPEYDQSFDAMTLGKRIRFGKDWWSTFSNFGDVEIGKKKIKGGIWYLALERSKKGDFGLVFLDAAEMHKQSMDPFTSAKTAGGTVVPLEYAKAADSASELKITIEPVEGSQLEQTWTIHWGPHLLKANVKARG